jgi:hypothetical protein
MLRLLQLLRLKRKLPQRRLSLKKRHPLRHKKQLNN